MSNQLLLLKEITYKPPAKIITKKTGGLGKQDSDKKIERKLPLFYTEPIFKAKRHCIL
jgi:hypothetical protein